MNKKKSGRPSGQSKKSYALWVLKNNQWVVATGETQEELEVFEMLKDPVKLDHWINELKNAPVSSTP